jgi:hypothetical protein
MAKVARKLFRYRESIILLKKALEYVWCKNDAEKLNDKFISYLQANGSKEEAAAFS